MTVVEVVAAKQSIELSGRDLVEVLKGMLDVSVIFKHEPDVHAGVEGHIED